MVIILMVKSHQSTVDIKCFYCVSYYTDIIQMTNRQLATSESQGSTHDVILAIIDNTVCN